MPRGPTDRTDTMSSERDRCVNCSLHVVSVIEGLEAIQAVEWSFPCGKP